MITLQPDLMLRGDRRVFARFARELLRMDPATQRLYFGDDCKRKIDSLAVFVAAYEYALSLEFDKRFRYKHTLPPQPKLPMLAEPEDNDAPSIELVLELRFHAYQLDIDSLDPMDAVDLEQERAWCDYWYSWYADQLDAS